MASVESEFLNLVNDIYSVATLNDNSNFIFSTNQYLYYSDPYVIEGLLQLHQVQYHGIVVDDILWRHISITCDLGTQCIR